MRQYIIGVDLGGTKIYTAVANKKKKILSRVKIKTEAAYGKEHVLNNIFSSIEKASLKAGIQLSDLAGIGFGVPGPVDYSSGLVRICPNIPGWKNIPIKTILEEQYKTNVWVENDARVAGLAEAKHGAGKGLQHIFYMTVSTGIGGAIIINGKIYHGADGVAGEIGHIKFPDGETLENIASGPAIQHLFQIPPEKLKDQVLRDYPDAKKALNHLTHYLGISMANIATLLNPQMIIIGGGLSNIGKMLIDPIRKKVREHAFSISGKNVVVKKAKLKNDSGILGALELCQIS